MLPQVTLYLGGGVPVTLTWYSIQSPFFTPTEKSANADGNNAVTISTVKAIARAAGLRKLSRIVAALLL